MIGRGVLRCAAILWLGLTMHSTGLAMPSTAQAADDAGASAGVAAMAQAERSGHERARAIGRALRRAIRQEIASAPPVAPARPAATAGAAEASLSREILGLTDDARRLVDAVDVRLIAIADRLDALDAERAARGGTSGSERAVLARAGDAPPRGRPEDPDASQALERMLERHFWALHDLRRSAMARAGRPVERSALDLSISLGRTLLDRISLATALEADRAFAQTILPALTARREALADDARALAALRARIGRTDAAVTARLDALHALLAHEDARIGALAAPAGDRRSAAPSGTARADAAGADEGAAGTRAASAGPIIQQ